jgi:hypothetical protein
MQKRRVATSVHGTSRLWEKLKPGKGVEQVPTVQRKPFDGRGLPGVLVVRALRGRFGVGRGLAG